MNNDIQNISSGKPKPIKVLLVTPLLSYYGVSRVIINLLDEFDRKMIEPVFVFYSSRHRRPIPVGLRAYHLELPDSGNYKEFVRFPRRALRIAKIIRKEHPDILLGFLTRINACVILAHLLTSGKSKLIVREGSSVSVGFKSRLSTGQFLKGLFRSTKVQQRSSLQEIFSFIARFFLRRLYPRASRILAVSECIKKELVENFSLAPDLIEVIYNPINVGNIKSQAREEVTEHPWFAQDIPIIVTAARLVREKRQRDLLRAFKILSKTCNCRLVFIGDGEEEKTLRELAAQERIEDHVAFLGLQKNPFKFMRRAQVFVLSSEWEGFGNVIAEALACNVPVISTDCPCGPNEIIQNGVNGILVPVGDEKALASAILQVLTDKNLARSLSEESNANLGRFHSREIASQYLAAFKKVLDSRHSAQSFL